MIGNLSSGTRVTRLMAGESTIHLPLQAPGTIGGTAYGLKSVQMCYSEAGGEASITTTAFVQADGGADSHALFVDATVRDMTDTACYTVTDPEPATLTGGLTLELTLSYPDSGVAMLDNGRSTWTPENL